jgi:MoaA/NifB/PqqE/SkfB family radical SAM enzyme
MVWQPDQEEAWQALRNVLAADLFVAVHLTLTGENSERIPVLLQRLAGEGVQAVSLSANDPALKEQLQAVREEAANLGLELVWNLPVPYSLLNPVALETAEQSQIEGPGRAWLYVEPDGDVLPAQGVNQVLGNFLRDPWEKIWER